MAVILASAHSRLPTRGNSDLPPSNISAATTAIAPSTAAAANAGLDLTCHSLNAVVAYDKTLWQPPLKWTRAHLLALGIRRPRRRQRDDQTGSISSAATNQEEEDGSDTDDDDDYEGGGGGGGNYHVIIPDLAPALLDRYMASFLKGVPYEMRVSRLVRLLRMPRQPKLIPTADGHDHERHDDSVIGQPFSSRWMTPELIVGQRMYNLCLLFHLLLSDTLVLPYVDSSCVLRPRFPVRHRRDLTHPFEPFIAAVLISRAQSLSPPPFGKERGDQSSPNGAVEKSVMDSLITTQLLFTHRDDQQDIHVYTALISRALLDRFRYPNQPPATTAADIQNYFMDSLIRLDHRRVPYEPRVTFRQRLLAAVSITAILKSNLEGGTSYRKRALSSDGRVYTVGPKRPRRPEYPSNPLSSLDPKFHAS